MVNYRFIQALGFVVTISAVFVHGWIGWVIFGVGIIISWVTDILLKFEKHQNE